MLAQYEMLFPFESVPKGAKILIYGAGKDGEHFLRQILITNYCDVLGFVDRNNMKQYPYLVPVYSMVDALRLTFDYIVISVKNPVDATEIRTSLVQHGVQSSKIIYKGRRKDVSCINAGLKTEVNYRDFTLNSGERQVGTDLRDIRKDHIYRYQLAANILNKCQCNVVLDCFCGTGYGTYYIARELQNVVFCGIDASRESIDFANHYYSAANTYFSNKVYPFQLPQDTFDFIICFESMEHIENGLMFVRDLIKALKKNGYLVLSAPNEDVNPLNITKNKFHYKHYTRNELSSVFSDELAVVKWYGQNVYNIDGGKVNGLLEEDKMKPLEKTEGQINIFVYKKR